jgi:hypothetical protein
MSFNSVNQLTGTHKTWDHVGNLIPDVEISEGFRPYLEAKPAAWLPVQFWEKSMEDWLVCMPGKLLTADPQGRIVPAQYGLDSSTVTYTTNDVNAKTIDVRNGNACTSSSVSAGAITLSGVGAWMGVTGVTWSAKAPLGVAPYAFLQWAGDGSALDTGGNPAAYRFHNYNKQHQVALLCDYALELPVVPASQTAVALTAGVRTGSVQVFSALGSLPVAKNTARTPIAFSNGNAADAATRFVNEVESASDVVSAGDWHVNLTTGVISVYTNATLSTSDYNVAYYHYASAPGSVSVFACVVGNPQGGDFLKSDSNSNWTLATPKVYGDGVTDNFDTFSAIMGQVLEVQSQPRDLLDRVRTAYSSLGTDATGALPGTAGQFDQMPGSATGGVSDKVNYAGAANLVALVNLVSR